MAFAMDVGQSPHALVNIHVKPQKRLIYQRPSGGGLGEKGEPFGGTALE